MSLTLPPAIYQKENLHMMQFLDGIATELAPCEMNCLSDSNGILRTNKDSDPSGLMHFEQRCDWGKARNI